ncbi:MAG: hypothetical protein IGQ88_00395 [Gloeomargaritaceae cyanobacterium C42_A2020_066]|nr:hypothetical protein [Gloeomargaritaceae cyanobacterium C42_A2020_066]
MQGIVNKVGVVAVGLAAASIAETIDLKPAQAITLTIPTTPITNLNGGVGLGYASAGGGGAGGGSGQALFTFTGAGQSAGAFSGLSPTFSPGATLTRVTFNNLNIATIAPGRTANATLGLYALPAPVVGAVGVPAVSAVPDIVLASNPALPFDTLASIGGPLNLTLFSGSQALNPAFQYFLGITLQNSTGTGVSVVSFDSISFRIRNVPVPPQILGVALTGAMAAWRKRKSEMQKATAAV